jgi:hypothetical protein
MAISKYHMLLFVASILKVTSDNNDKLNEVFGHKRSLQK